MLRMGLVCDERQVELERPHAHPPYIRIHGHGAVVIARSCVDTELPARAGLLEADYKHDGDIRCGRPAAGLGALQQVERGAARGSGSARRYP
jgi:hypothetical protein